MRPVGERPFKPLVVGAPRTGFSLCIGILHSFAGALPNKRDLKQSILDTFTEVFDQYITTAIVETFADHGITDKLILNGNFRILLGGPKWIRADREDRCAVRKYIGVKGMGDLTLITSHPLQVMDKDNIIHSHEKPNSWIEHPYYDDYIKIATVRNPIGTLNSSCFSINALTSEYIQKTLTPEEDNDELRQELAAYKFTDLDFFNGLVVFLKRYCDSFMEIADSFDIMRWEDLIQRPTQTIRMLGRFANIDVDEEIAQRIWAAIDHTNMTGHHKHNLRKGAGIVGGWKSWLTNHHLDIIKEAGFTEFMKRFGYDKIEYLDENKYTEYQNRMNEAIEKNTKIKSNVDDDLFGFAFNKSNLDSTSFSFRRHEWRAETQIERSCFTDEKIEMAVWDAAERACSQVNNVYDMILRSRFYESRSANRSIRALEGAFSGTFDYNHNNRFEMGVKHAEKLTRSYFQPVKFATGAS